MNSTTHASEVKVITKQPSKQSIRCTATKRRNAALLDSAIEDAVARKA